MAVIEAACYQDDPILLTIGRILHDNGTELHGVLTHAGESYGAVGLAAQTVFAELERAATVAAAEALRAADLPCSEVRSDPLRPLIRRQILSA